MNIIILAALAANFILLVVIFRKVSILVGDNQTLRDLIDEVSANPGDFLKD